jgi:hypothetical protein
LLKKSVACQTKSNQTKETPGKTATGNSRKISSGEVIKASKLVQIEIVVASSMESKSSVDLDDSFHNLPLSKLIQPKKRH